MTWAVTYRDQPAPAEFTTRPFRSEGDARALFQLLAGDDNVNGLELKEWVRGDWVVHERHDFRRID